MSLAHLRFTSPLLLYNRYNTHIHTHAHSFTQDISSYAGADVAAPVFHFHSLTLPVSFSIFLGAANIFHISAVCLFVLCFASHYHPHPHPCALPILLTMSVCVYVTYTQRVPYFYMAGGQQELRLGLGLGQQAACN